MKVMFLSERDCQRWRSLDISPAISKAKTATFDFFIGFGFGAPEAKLFDIAVFTFISQVSRAMMNYESYVIV